MNRDIEVRIRTGDKQYNDLALFVTSMSNVRDFNTNTTLAEEMLIIKEIVENAKTVTATNYTVTENGLTELTINNPNYINLESELEVFCNGKLLLKEHEYNIVGNKISLINFPIYNDDKFTFKVYNNFKLDVDMSFLELPSEEQAAISELNNAFNNYVSLINEFKSKIKTYLSAIDVEVSIDDSLEAYANIIRENLKTKFVMPKDFGSLIGFPYFKHNISFSMGGLEGVRSDIIYIGYDLGSIL